MSADNLQAVREALAEVFNESNLNATGTGSLKTSFDHETLSEAFSEPHLNAANAGQSFSRVNHAALTGLFRDSRSERPSSTSFNQAFVDTLSERSPLSSKLQSPRPGFDHQAFAEILSEPPPMSTGTNPSRPSFDHQALAEMLTESRAADPVDPPTSALSFDPNFLPSFSSSFGQGAHGEPAATTSPSASAEGARPPIAKSLLAKLHYLFSTKEEPSQLVVEKDRSPQALSGQSNNPGEIATDFSTPSEGASTHPFGSAPTDLPALSLEREPISSRISGQSGDGSPAVNDVRVTSAIDPVGMGPTSSLNEEPYPVSTDTKSSPTTFERRPSTPTVASRLDKVDHKDVAASVAAPPEVGSAPQLQARSLLIEPVFPNSNNIKSTPPVFRRVQSGPVISSPADAENVKPPEGSDTEKLLPRLAELISPSPTPSLGSQAVSSHPTLSGQPDALAPTEDIVSAAARADVEHARPQLPRSLIVELALPVANDTGSPLRLQQEPSPARFSDRSKDTISVVSPDAASFPTNGESAEPQLRRLLAELTPTISADPTPPLAIAEKDPFLRADLTAVKGPHHAAKTASPSESAIVQRCETEGLLSEILSPASSNSESHSFIFENETSPRSFPGKLDGTSPAIAPVAATPPVHAAMKQPRSLPLTDLPALISTDTSSSTSAYEQIALPSSSLHRPESVEPPVSSVLAVPNDAENAVPRHVSPLLTAIQVLNAKPSPPLLEKTRSVSALASQPDKAEMSTEPVAHPTDAERVSAKPARSLRPDMSSTASTDIQLSAPVLEKDRWRPLVSDQPAERPAVQSAAVAYSADTESMVVTRAQQAKSLLDKLDLNTAIRLRWTIRDIRGKRTKFSPVSDDDLTALMNLGLVEMREGLPRLTGLGVLALD